MYRDAEYAVIDLETTGFSPKHHDRIIEVGVVRIDPHGNKLREYCTLINPHRDIGATQVHGITATDVAEAPTFRDVVGDIQQALRGAIVVAHNAQFDLRFLCHECSQSHAPLPEIIALCTLSLAKQVVPELPSRKLSVLCEYFGMPSGKSHTALDDARATASLLAVLLRSFGVPARKISWEELGAKLVQSPVSTWPCVAPSGREYRRTSAASRRRQGNPRLATLFSRLPAHNDTNNCADEYLAVLELALEDREITEEEIAVLGDVACSLDMDTEELKETHNRFLQDMVRAAWADKVITDAEKKDIDSVAGLLGIEEGQYSRMISEVQDDRLLVESAVESRAESLTGKAVCFTGTSNAMIDGELVSRSTLERLAEENGMIVKKGVTKSLDLLVCTDPKSMSGKARKARQYGVRIVAEGSFLRKFGI